MNIEVRNIMKSFKSTQALKNVSFDIEEKELLTLIGPSGSGKTTLLRIIAQIESRDRGDITYPAGWSGKNILVFQDYLLFPHLSVFENIAFGLRAAKKKKNHIEKQVSRYLEIFHIQDKRDVFPNQLSGGQKQRVAIARAMILEPSLLLLDEPFANLDKQLKLETAHFIRRIQKELGTTTICVTHDMEEAFAMSDRIGVLINGSLHQIDEPEQIYFSPASIETAQLLGPINMISPSLYQELGFPIDSVGKENFIRTEALEIYPQGDEKGLPGGVIKEKRFSGMVIHYLVSFKDFSLNVTSLDSNYELGEKVRIALSQRYLANKPFSIQPREVI